MTELRRHFAPGTVRRLLVAASTAIACYAAFTNDCAAATAKRIALVVGNSDYRHVAHLPNPANDAELVVKTLKGLGFTFIGQGAQLNLDKDAFDQAVMDFGNAAQNADVALFYYAGHGLQIKGHNYLVPVSANPRKEADVDFQMLDVGLVLRQMESAGTKLNIVILDACRNNPFSGRGLRAISGGLAQMQAPEGTLISFSTQPGNVALDGKGDHSPFTTALTKVLPRPGLDIFRTFNEVGLQVSAATGGEQQPWVSSSPIRGDFYFGGPPGPSPDVVLRQHFQAAERIDTIKAWDSFLATYPSGYFSDLARAEREKIVANERAKAAAVAQTKAEAEAKAKAAAEAMAKAEAEAKAKAAAAAERARAEAEARSKAAAKAQAETAAKIAAANKARRDEELKAEQAASQKAAALDQARRDAEVKATQAAVEKIASDIAAKTAREVAEKAAREAAQQLAHQAATPASAPPQQVATLASPATRPTANSLYSNPADLIRLLKIHLRDVGCDPGDDTGVWDTSARHALAEFDKYAKAHLDADAPSVGALDAVAAQKGRICPLVCGSGTRREGNRCVAIRTTPKSPSRSRGSTGPSVSHEQLRNQCRGNVASACRTLCSTGHPRACQKLRRLGGL
ncbi:MAG: hypothetical protein GC182_23285 [Rhodopseudomonas sp.]|nr:hypothetical protein [Rhodopseudomonas sp.]